MNDVDHLRQNRTESRLLEKKVEMKTLGVHQQEDQTNDRQLLEVKEEEEEEEEEVPHLWSSGLDQQDPELLVIKKEEEDLWSSQEGEQLPVTSEDEKSPQLFQLHRIKTEDDRETEPPTSSSAEQMKTETDEEDCGGPEPDPAGSRAKWRSAAPVAGPAVSDEEDSEASSASQHAPAQEKKKRKSPAAADGDRQYFWRDGHQDTMAEFWLSHPIFYDKAQQHYKNKEMKLQLMQELIEQNCEDWEKLHSPLPTVIQVDAHLRNMRTRFVKLLKRKSSTPALILSYTDQRIWERYQFLRPYIQRGRTSATHTFPGVPPGGDAAADEGEDDDKSLLWTQQPSTSQIQAKGKGKRKNRRLLTSPLPSTLLDSEDISKMEILQQAKNLICNIRAPTRSDHERRVRDFSRYMESEMLRIPESSWDECSFTIMNVIRGFKAAQQPAHLAMSQQQTYQQSYGGQYQQQGGYYSQQSGTF
ncbi:uncharacterized protein LOC108245612 isoform X3 [Kryptolebias marmoratus]|uniref:uncharacterized protein LOC108245612 isoform X3 n=1 Tax=Kryptolebias marmoratus TaxID=37003 RepID=UPI0007F8A2C6|nr:uncharacterized protein LOC108245612 isoform X3 [Kryptolebias marmoratus]